MDTKTIVGKAIKANGANRTASVGMPRWGTKAIYRLAQIAKEPGIYPVALIRCRDGRMQMVVGNRVEELGR